MSSVALVPTLVSTRRRLADLAIVAGGVALIAVAAQIVIPLPFTPVPVTGQTFAVLVVGASYGALRGTVTLLAYLAVGLAGLPVFAEGSAGAAALTAPAGGYLIGMLAAGALVGMAAERGWDRSPLRAGVAMTAGNLVIYAFGLTWLAASLGTGPTETIMLGAVPFVLGDIVKIVLAAAILPGAWKAIGRIRQSLD